MDMDLFAAVSVAVLSGFDQAIEFFLGSSVFQI